MRNLIVEFWRNIPKKEPFIHPQDIKFLKKNKDFANYSSWNSFTRQPDWDPFKKYKFQTSLVPVPYWGDLNKAVIIILMCNPHFDCGNIWAEEISSKFKLALWKNLHQSSKKNFVPFLDPEFSWYPGFNYWASRFKKTIEQIRKKDSCSFQDALEFLSEKVACLQLVPYSSSTFCLSEKIKEQLPSTFMAKEFAKNYLQVEAKKGNKLIIVVRKSNEWKLKPHKNILGVKESVRRGAYFESDGKALKAIWRMLNIPS